MATKKLGTRQDATSEALDHLIGGSDTEPPRNGYVPDAPEKATEHTVRIRPSVWTKLEGVLRRADLKKGPTMDALADLLVTGDIDIKLVRRRIKEIRGVEVEE